MHPDSRVIENLLSVGRAATEGSNTIVLWCRQLQADGRTFTPYYCLGRLAYSSHNPETMPVSFVWTLLDYDELVAKDNPVVKKMMGNT